ncbi:hypothetical protein [Coleofasciculus sp. FACHB-1120]|uniref:hypothetical protein n=1 Tax=Coleofasciculus sp. FACHB-1120 TaxID=2692783 RepID=UPI001682D024|nr:hypothetical protein [Coleofasciculus sp. FACHB-1120]MBD2745065.1 hypothetical protein [Coleofasciculus sp. FACHB-1120]
MAGVINAIAILISLVEIFSSLGSQLFKQCFNLALPSFQPFYFSAIALHPIEVGCRKPNLYSNTIAILANAECDRASATERDRVCRNDAPH